MTPHLHAEHVEGCYRCELSRDELDGLLTLRLTCGHEEQVYEDDGGHPWRVGESILCDCGIVQITSITPVAPAETEGGER